MSPLELCAIAEAHFYAAAFRVLGIEFIRDETLWWAGEPVPAFFENVGVLRPTVPESHVVDVLAGTRGPVAVRDPFAVLDLTPYGFARRDHETWMIRSSAPVDAPIVEGMVVRRARRAEEVVLFERATHANTGNLDSYVKGALHPAATTVEETDLHLLVGLLDDQPVATAQAVVHPLVVGVQAVTTHPDERRRGIAHRMMAAVISAAPDRPTALAATPMGHRLYRSLGFVDAGPGSDWERR